MLDMHAQFNTETVNHSLFSLFFCEPDLCFRGERMNLHITSGLHRTICPSGPLQEEKVTAVINVQKQRGLSCFAETLLRQ